MMKTASLLLGLATALATPASASCPNAEAMDEANARALSRIVKAEIELGLGNWQHESTINSEFHSIASGIGTPFAFAFASEEVAKRHLPDFSIKQMPIQQTLLELARILDLTYDVVVLDDGGEVLLIDACDTKREGAPEE